VNGEDRALSTVVGDVETWLVAQKPQIALALPSFLTPDRMMRVFLTEIRKTPTLLQCSRQSLMSCMMQSAQLGLEPGGVMGHMYFVPYKGEATPIIGYKGLIDLARRSGQIVSISARVVYSKDEFRYAYGLNEYLEHVPALGDRGNPTFVYAVANLVGGGHAFEVMSVEQVNAIRNRAVSYMYAEDNQKKNSVWHLHWDEMARKTAIRRIYKYLPSSILPPEAREALYAEDTREFPESGSTAGMMQMPSEKKPAAAQESAQPAAAAPGSAEAQPGGASPAQLKYIMTLCGDLKIKTDDQRHAAIIQLIGGTGSTKDLGPADASLLIDKLQMLKNKKGSLTFDGDGTPEITLPK